MFTHSLAQVAGEIGGMREFSHLSGFIVERELEKSFDHNPWIITKPVAKLFTNGDEIVARFKPSEVVRLLARNKAIKCVGCEGRVTDDMNHRRKHVGYGNVFRSDVWRRFVGSRYMEVMEFFPALCPKCHTSFMAVVSKHRITGKENGRATLPGRYLVAANDWLSTRLDREAK